MTIFQIWVTRGKILLSYFPLPFYKICFSLKVSGLLSLIIEELSACIKSLLCIALNDIKWLYRFHYDCIIKTMIHDYNLYLTCEFVYKNTHLVKPLNKIFVFYTFSTFLQKDLPVFLCRHSTKCFKSYALCTGQGLYQKIDLIASIHYRNKYLLVMYCFFV